MSNPLKKACFLSLPNLVTKILGPLSSSLTGMNWDWIGHTVLPVVPLADTTRQNISQALKKQNVPIGWITIRHLVND